MRASLSSVAARTPGHGPRLAVLFAGLMAAFAPGLTAGAQQRPVPAPASAPSSTSAYRISGKVVDEHTGAALSRAAVRITDAKQRSESQSTISGDDGSFIFSGLSRGKYSLSAERRGYLEQSYEEHDQYSTAIAVGPGLDSENLVFKMTAEAILSGTVTDEAGEGIRGAQVRLYEDEDTNGIRSTRARQTVMTDDRGMYEIDELRPGAYFLAVTAHPWYAQILQRNPVAREGDYQPQPLNVGYPTTFYPGATDEDSATPIPVKGGDRLEANVSLTPQPALSLRVNMPQSGGGPRRGASVMLAQSIFGQTEGVPAQMMFQSDGTMEFAGILPGRYDVTITGVGGNGQPGDVKHFQADVATGSTQLAEDSAVGEITITGRVTTTAGKLPEHSGISLRTSNARRQQYAALSDAGEFTLTAAPGTYEVLGNITGMHISSMKATGGELAGRMLTVKTGDSPRLEIIAGTGHGEIEGAALRDGKPASGVMVLLAPEDIKNNEILFRRDQSDSDGTFDLDNIFPGKYRLLAIDRGWDLEWANPAVLAAFLAKSVPIEIKSGDHLQQPVQVQSR